MEDSNNTKPPELTLSSDHSLPVDKKSSDAILFQTVKMSYIILSVTTFEIHKTGLYRRTDQIPKRDEQISGGISAPLTGSENWFDKFLLINFFWL